MRNSVLLLNVGYQPMKTINIRKAVELIMKDKVYEVEGVARVLKTPSTTFKVPSVIRLKRYVNVPHLNLTWTKYRVLQRDNYTCIYCGDDGLPASQYTVDHIIPQSRGGKNTWGNTACACFPCNQKKGGNTPHEAGMKLLWEPKTPRTNYFVASGNVPVEWKKYIPV